MSEKTAGPWSRGNMTPAAQHDRRGRTGRPRKLTAVEEGEILQRACIQQAEHHAVNAAWVSATRTVCPSRALAASWTPYVVELASDRNRRNLRSERKRATTGGTLKTVVIVGRFSKSGINFIV
jgi:hypothetical protein